VIPHGMRVPVAVWQLCELITYACYLLTYLLTLVACLLSANTAVQWCSRRLYAGEARRSRRPVGWGLGRGALSPGSGGSIVSCPQARAANAFSAYSGPQNASRRKKIFLLFCEMTYFFLFYILLIWGVRTHPTHPTWPLPTACDGWGNLPAKKGRKNFGGWRCDY